MGTFRVALANVRFPLTPEESVTLAEHAIAQASIERAGIICFPECFIPGYRGMGKAVPPPNLAFLERAWTVIAAAAAKANLTVVLGTERVVENALDTCYFATVNFASAGSPTTSAVVRPDGTLLCYQPYGKEGLLIADIDITEATGMLAARCRTNRVR